MERKTIARSLGVAGLVAGSFLAGMLLFSGGGSRSAGSSAAPGVDAPAGNAIVTPTVTSTDGAPGIETPEAGGATGDTTMTGTLTAVAQEPAPQTEAVAEEQAPQQLEESQPQAPQPEPEAPQAEQEAPQPPEGEPEQPLEPDQDREPDPPSEPEPAEEFDVVVLAPGLVEALPADGAIGVNPGASLKLTFSQAMDTASVEAAFSVEPGVSGSFAWDPDGTAMTFTPDDDFAYGMVVQWELADTASDETGVPVLQAYSGSFRILRQNTVLLYSQADNDGYVHGPSVAALSKVVLDGGSHNTLKVGTWTRGFLSFDLAILPPDLVTITAAELRIHQRSHHAEAYSDATGALWVVSLPYGDLDAMDYSIPTPTVCPNVCYPLGKQLSAAAADGWKFVDLTILVQKDWNDTKGPEGPSPMGIKLRPSQFRLQFLNENGGDGPDVWAEFHSGEAGPKAPRLEVTYLYP